MRAGKRKSFRYTFAKPITALFQIVAIDDEIVSTSKGKAKIINISTRGVKFNSHLNIHKTEHKTIQLAISFKLNEQLINVDGNIVWKNNKGTSVDYGIAFIIEESDDPIEEIIIEQLKIYSRNNHQLENQKEAIS